MADQFQAEHRSGRSWRELAEIVLWKLGLRIRASSAFHRQVFTRIYRRHEWGDGESVSGQGSSRARGADIRDGILALLKAYEVKSLLDAPCGDFNWMRELVRDELQYTGVDIVEELIVSNRTRYGGPGRQFILADLTRDPLPRADLVLCRDALVHFSFADIRSAIRNFKRSGSRYLLATTFLDLASNEDVRTGGWRMLNLQAAPFSFPPPLAFVDERVRDKRLALWELDSLTL